MKKAIVVSLAVMFGVCACGKQQPTGTASTARPSPAATGPVSGPFTESELKQFAALDPIDTHTHAYRNSPALYSMLDRLNLHILDIVIVDDRIPELKDLSAETEAAWKVVQGSKGRAALCTTFDPFKFRDADFAKTSIRWLNGQFSKGAVAVKIWKNIGMEIKDAKGNYILPDNPLFGPIYKDIAAHGKTLIAHVADPDSAWAPPNPASPDYSYYKENPEWYMYDKSHPASKEQILQARDRLVAANPKLRVVGAHLGSMEVDFNQLGRDLDRYPNFAVDMAARVPYMMLQPRADIIAFINAHQDRLIYATDNEFFSKDKGQPTMAEWEKTYARDWRFFATDDILDYRGHKVQGLALPPSILHKLYHDNAVRWFPGILNGPH
jgi:predicted TIM-barrel fold metal-dependent hydrolase